MADPVTLTGISIGATALGGLTKAFGDITSGNAQSAMYKYQSGIALMNQQINKQNADYERQVGEVQAQQSGIKTREQIGTIKSVQSGSNVDINSGSAAGVRESQSEVGLQDQAIIRSNAARRAYGYEVEAAQNKAQSDIYQMSAAKSKTSGIIGALGSILGTAGSVAGKWLDANRTGIGSSSDGYYGSSPETNPNLMPV